jgi:energy-converting hydrogenase Eha subunit E
MKIFLILLVSAAAGCDIAELPPAPKRDNPIDPANPVFEDPVAILYAGPKNNAIVDTHTVVFAWRGNLNDRSMLFSFRRDDDPWSPYDTVTRAVYDYLDEVASRFEVKGKYVNGFEQEVPTQVNFTVNAVSGPALMFFPRKRNTVRNGLFTVDVRVEESTEFAGAKVTLHYNPKMLELSGAPVIPVDTDNLMLKNGGTLIDFVHTDPVTGIIELNLAVTGGSLNNVAGSGSIARLTFKAVGASGTTSVISFGSSSALRRDDNAPVPLQQLTTAVVDIL